MRKSYLHCSLYWTAFQLVYARSPGYPPHFFPPNEHHFTSLPVHEIWILDRIKPNLARCVAPSWPCVTKFASPGSLVKLRRAHVILGGSSRSPILYLSYPGHVTLAVENAGPNTRPYWRCRMDTAAYAFVAIAMMRSQQLFEPFQGALASQSKWGARFI